MASSALSENGSLVALANSSCSGHPEVKVGGVSYVRVKAICPAATAHATALGCHL